MKYWRFVGLFVALLLMAALPQATGHINDYAQIFTARERKAMEQDLRQFRETHGHEIAVVSLKSLQGQSIERVANELFREWGIGGKEHNNGVLVLITLQERLARIEVGYGLEGALTDTESYHIQNQKMIPEFKRGRFGVGVQGALDAIKREIEGEHQAPPKHASTPLPWSKIFYVYIFLLLAFNFWAQFENPVYLGLAGAAIGFCVSYHVFQFNAFPQILTLMSGSTAALAGGGYFSEKYLLKKRILKETLLKTAYRYRIAYIALGGLLMLFARSDVPLFALLFVALLWLLNFKPVMSISLMIYTLYTLWYWLSDIGIIALSPEEFFDGIYALSQALNQFFAAISLYGGAVLMLLFVLFAMLGPKSKDSRRRARYEHDDEVLRREVQRPRDDFDGFGGGSSGGGGSTSSW